MASIVQRKNSYSVVYSYTENGKRHQRWETFKSLQEATLRKEQVEDYYSKIKPLAEKRDGTLANLLAEYIEFHGKMAWSFSTYQENVGLIYAYINPHIGNMRLEEFTPKSVAKIYREFLTLKRVDSPYQPGRDRLVSNQTLRSIHKLLHSVFEKAVIWEYVEKNPFHHAVLPKVTPLQQNILSSEQVRILLRNCTDERLKLIIQFAFVGTLRKGEILALTWQDIDFTNNTVSVSKSISRVNKEAINQLNRKDIIYQFAPILKSEKTAVIIKVPKTKSSIRTVYLPQSFINELKIYKANQSPFYKDNIDMIFRHDDGRIYQDSTLQVDFKKAVVHSNLPSVTFHSLRHSSITYKLILTGGNIKAVQGDSGHATADMITERYSHIIDWCRIDSANLLQKISISKLAI